MRSLVFWIWSALSSLADALGAPPRVAVGAGLILLAGAVAAITAPATAAVMTHTRDRIAVRQQARVWSGRRPNRSEWSLINDTHAIHVLSPVTRAVAVAVPAIVGLVFWANTPTGYVADWGDSGTATAFEDLVLFADRPMTDTGFILVFTGLWLASVLFAYVAARLTTSWRLGRPKLTYAPTAYAIACGVGLGVVLLIANPLTLAYAAAYLGWVILIGFVTAIGKAPKAFVPSLLDTSEREEPRAEPADAPDAPDAPNPQRTLLAADASGFDSPAPAGTVTTPALRCQPIRPGDPTTVGAYRVQGRLGSGAMGTVFLAASPHGQPVALKVLAPALAHDDDSRRRFFREMHALRHIDSPRVVGVLDSGVAGDTPFIAMTAIEGPDVASHVRDNAPMGDTDLATLAGGLAEGLAAVHEQGLVHRDVKPSNIIWSSTGPCLVDFGLAHLGDQTRVTSTGLVIGSPSYVSPERLRGTTATAASDVWNWAACLAFAASGRNLYRSDHPAALWQRILNQDYDAESLDRLRVLGTDVHDLATSCLRTDPSERPTDGGDLLRRYRAATT